jgi:hypothetical protein
MLPTVTPDSPELQHADSHSLTAEPEMFCGVMPAASILLAARIMLSLYPGETSLARRYVSARVVIDVAGGILYTPPSGSLVVSPPALAATTRSTDA